jgi:hypothetical protein
MMDQGSATTNCVPCCKAHRDGERILFLGYLQQCFSTEQWNVTTALLDIIHRPVFHLKHNVRRLDSVFVFRWKLLSWAQQTVLVSVARLCFAQTQRKISERWKEWRLWYSGLGSRLQIQKSGFDSRRYQIIWEVVGLERSPLSLVSITGELLERKRSGSGLEIEITAVGDPPRWLRDTPLFAKIWH